ncbi:MAG: HNH endonuclease [Gammaproteobacteria bacterium]|uniref:Putative homing endonuclease n=1 Tax=viral metagenome TaxID=1070528 RepID=A0A6M3M797_9ZZZZ|nr:HNH endonuclease [Gammaproteobacteria bacterium]
MTHANECASTRSANAAAGTEKTYAPEHSFVYDDSLSWRARGVLAYAATHDEPITVKLLVSLAGKDSKKFGKEAAASVLNEIINAGYASSVGTDRITYVKDKITQELRDAVLARDGHRCVECGSNKRLCADHVVPESKGGETTLDNLQAMCRPCNSEKGAMIEGAPQ